MATTKKVNPEFSRRLRAELERQGLGVRTLARRMDPENPERTRRSLNKWLAKDNLPSLASRHAIADALGVGHDFFPDEEEESLTAAELMDVLMDLVRQRRQSRVGVAA